MVKSFYYIAASKYFNVLVEYLVVIMTSRMLSLEDRSDFIMITSSAILLSTISGLSFDQYGAKEYYKNSRFNYISYFKTTSILGVVVGLISLPVFLVVLQFSVFHFVLMFLLSMAILLTKQYIVLYQINNLIDKYSKIMIINKSLLIIILLLVSFLLPSLELFLILYTFLYILGLVLLYVGCANADILDGDIDIVASFRDFQKNKLLYFTTIVTSLFYYLNYLLIYKYIDKASLSYFHIALQYNLVFIVLAQTFNIYFLSNRSRVSVSYFFQSLSKIYIFIASIFIANLILVYSPVFPLIIEIVFGDKYVLSINVFKSVVWMLPPMLISMFFVSLWVVSNKYKLLFKTNLIGLLIFLFSAIILLKYFDDTVYSVIYAMYISSIYSIFANHYLIYFYKRKVRCYQ